MYEQSWPGSLITNGDSARQAGLAGSLGNNQLTAQANSPQKKIAHSLHLACNELYIYDFESEI